jgi:uncharacterized protein (TIGR04222 family)
MFVVGGSEKKESEPPQQAGAVPILAGVIRSKLALGTHLSIPTSERYSSNSYLLRAQIRSSERTHIWPVEMLRRIPGPKFLVFFIALIGACIGIGWLWINADGTGSYPLPELARFDAFAIAALRGGSAAAIRAAVFSLWNQKLVEISTSKSSWTGKKIEVKSISEEKVEAISMSGERTEVRSVSGKKRVLSPIDEEVHKYLQKAKFKVLSPIAEEIRRSLQKAKCQAKTVPSRKIVLSPIEEEVYQYLQTSRDPRTLFQPAWINASLKSRIERYLEPVRRELEELHLICTDTQKTHAWMIAIALASVIAVVGGTKLYLGTTYNKPSLILVILLSASLGGLISIVKRWRLGTLTQLGRRYLKALEEHFAWLKKPADLDRNPEGVDPTLSIAVFGISVLGGTAMYDTFCEAFPLSKSGGGCGGGGGGCGGGCGGCGGG